MMVRRSGRRRPVAAEASQELDGVVPRPGLDQTRNQPLIEDQEIEIQQETVDVVQPESDMKFLETRGIPNVRRSSHDSAISSKRSRWSVSSNVSVVSRISRPSSSDRTVQDPDSVPEGEAKHLSNDVNTDTLTWVKNLTASRVRNVSITSRTRIYANGSVKRQTPSTVTESSGTDSGYDAAIDDRSSGLASEAWIHLHIILFWAFVLSTEEYLKAEYPDSSNINVPIYRVALQLAASIALGVISDLTSPKMALILPLVVCLQCGFLLYFKLEQIVIFEAPYLHYFSSGLLGSQLLVMKLHPWSNPAAAFSRITLTYGLASFLCPFVINMSSHYLGAPCNFVVGALATILSLTAVLRNYPSNNPNDDPRTVLLTPDGPQWKHTVGYTVMKLAATAPLALLLPLINGMLKESSSNSSLPPTVTLVLLIVQALMVPLLLLCTTPTTVITSVAAMLLVLYPVMALMMSNSMLLMMMVPVCGLMSVLQNLVMSGLVTSVPNAPGLMLSFNLLLHTSMRASIPQLTQHLVGKCSDNSTSLLVLPWNYDQAGVNIAEGNSVSFFRTNDFFCEAPYSRSLSLIGAVCSLTLLICVQIMCAVE